MGANEQRTFPIDEVARAYTKKLNFLFINLINLKEFL